MSGYQWSYELSLSVRLLPAPPAESLSGIQRREETGEEVRTRLELLPRCLQRQREGPGGRAPPPGTA